MIDGESHNERQEEITQELPKTGSEKTTARGRAPVGGARDGHTQELLPSKDGLTQELTSPLADPDEGERLVDLRPYIEEYRKSLGADPDNKPGRGKRGEPPQTGPRKKTS